VPRHQLDVAAAERRDRAHLHACVSGQRLERLVERQRQHRARLPVGEHLDVALVHAPDEHARQPHVAGLAEALGVGEHRLDVVGRHEREPARVQCVDEVDRDDAHQHRDCAEQDGLAHEQAAVAPHFESPSR
jgi:hypothetical protein